MAIGTVLLIFLAWVAIDAAAGAATLAVGGSAGPAWLATLGNLCVTLNFAQTLRPGREPLISRYSRFDVAGLPDADGRYTRGLTMVWTVLLGGFTLGHAAAALWGWPMAALAVVQPLTCGGLFLGEHILRNQRFPAQGRATPLRTLRAIWRAHAAATGPAAGHAARHGA